MLAVYLHKGCSVHYGQQASEIESGYCPGAYGTLFSAGGPLSRALPLPDHLRLLLGGLAALRPAAGQAMRGRRGWNNDETKPGQGAIKHAILQVRLHQKALSAFECTHRGFAAQKKLKHAVA